MFGFNNPTPIELSFNEPVGEVVQLDFNLDETKPEGKPEGKVEEPSGNPTGNSSQEPIAEPVTLGKPSSVTKPKVEKVSPTEPDEDLTFEDTEGVESEGTEQDIDSLVNIANSLAESTFGGNLKPYEGYDAEAEPNAETITKLIAHNITVAREEAVQDFYDNGLSDVVKRIVDFDMDAENPEDLLGFIRTLGEEATIKNLSLDNEFDQEKIVRTWYLNEQWDANEIEEKVADLKTAGLLSKEATRIKPKLDAKSEEVARKKEENLKMMKTIENERRKEFLGKVQTTLKSQQIGGIQLTPDEVQRIGAAMTDSPIKINLGDKETEMPYLEALIAWNRYSPKGDVETLAMATLLLSDRKAFEKKYMQSVETKVSNEFVQKHKYDAGLKTGQIKVETKKKEQPATAPKWNLSVR